MAYSTGFTAATGATYTAAQYNTYVRDNFAAIWVYSVAGDIAYASSPTTLNRLGIGANNSLMMSNGSAPTWLAPGTALQQPRINAGGTAIEWFTPGSGLPGSGTKYQGLRKNSDASAEEWAALLSLLGRQGGNVTDWSTPGTSVFTPADALIEIGSLSISMSGTPATGSGSVVFPVAFAAKPIVFVSSDVPNSSGVWLEYGANNISIAGFDFIYCYNAASGSYGNRVLSWLAIGPK